MHTAEIVVSEMQRNSSFQVRQLLTERISQTCEPAKLHPHGEVLPFHETGRNVLRVGITSSDLGYDLRDAWWGVPRFGAVQLTKVAEQFHKLREIGIQPERVRNRALIVMQPVCSDLNGIGYALVQ